MSRRRDPEAVPPPGKITLRTGSEVDSSAHGNERINSRDAGARGGGSGGFGCGGSEVPGSVLHASDSFR